MHHRHRILDGDRLRAGRLDVDLGAAEAGQDQRLAAVHEVAAVELGRDVDGEVELAEGVAASTCQSGMAATKLPPMPMKTSHLALGHRLERGDDVVAVRARAA